MSESNFRIGVDLGGTKIEAIVMDRNDDIILRRRVDTPKNDYEATVDTICELIGKVDSEVSMPTDLPVGIGTPGAVSLATGMMKNCNSTCLNGRALKDDLTSRLGRPVRLANDADCFTLSEAKDGAAARVSVVFGIILGTGVGGGICIDGTLVQGVNAIAGEWGHATLPLNGYRPGDAEAIATPRPGQRECFCGRRDCLETWVSGTGFERSYRELTGRELAAREVIQRMQAGEGEARQVFLQYCNMLALALSTVINVLDPEVIVAGGGMSNVDEIYQQVPEHWPNYVFSDSIDTKFVKARHGDSSGVRGAAWLS